MDSRTVAHTLWQIAELLDLKGDNRFRARAFKTAAKAIVALDVDDIGPLYRSGALAKERGIGPAMLGVIGELLERGESPYLRRLGEGAPAGLIEMARIPGLGLAKLGMIHERLGVETIDDLEAAARDGRLATLPRFGARTAAKVLKGIEFFRATGAQMLRPVAAVEAQLLLANVRRHPDVVQAEVAGSVRRRNEVAGNVDIVAACGADPVVVAASFARAPGASELSGAGEASVTVRFVDGAVLHLHCVPPDEWGVALWRATGSAAHDAAIRRRVDVRKLTLEGNVLADRAGKRVRAADEAAFYRALGLSFIPPELREGLGEVETAAKDALPTLIERADLRGVLHCHSTWSDGVSTIEEMALAAQARGWSYIGISDHSEAAFYASGLPRDAIARQHEEIDEINARLTGIRVLKGIEADILADGRLDYDETLLARFDYVIGSVHSRFQMSGAQMTERVLRALDDPNLTILGHPTGRLLLSREPYAIDMEAVIDKAAENDVALELNADPHRLDLDWRYLRVAKQRGVTIAIGPDAHSPAGLDYVDDGIGIARKGWLSKADVLNTREIGELFEGRKG